EPTKSLDSNTEITAYRNILAGFPQQTIIAVEHRTHLLPMFDRICLFDGGKIIATGTLQELLVNSSEFRSLWQNSIAQV
ncbi:thiol reductant ABC exporter subunit CydD, partial [Listeria monocytogenes]